MTDYNEDPAVSVFFAVRVDDYDLGTFTACDGLGVEIKTEPYEEGGNNTFVHNLPGRMKWTNVKVTRPLNSDSATVTRWLSTMTGTISRTTAHIKAMTPDGKTVAEWNLTGVIPVRWQGPSLSTDGPKVATETLELAHHGFITT